MGQKGFESALARHAKIAVDSMVFIYHIEANASFLGLTRTLFHRIETGQVSAVTSVLSLLEVLTHPYRKGETELAVLYRGLITEFPHLTVHPLDQATAELAASVRAHYGISSPDAIQIATALRQGATVFVTNDKKRSQIKELDVLLLHSFVG